MIASALEVNRVTKEYPGVIALRDVSLAIRPGEIRAFVGKNGAGKSTLVKILSGAIRPDSGTIYIAGEEVDLSSPAEAKRLGIFSVHQDLSLVPAMSIAENIALGRWPSRRGVVDQKAVHRQAAESLTRLGISPDLRKPLKEFGLAYQQVVEIAKVLQGDAKLLIFDEPTSSLPEWEVGVVLQVIRRLADQGVAVLYISHRLAEVPRIADTVTVLRDGRVVGTEAVADLSMSDIIHMMTGHSETDFQVGDQQDQIASDQKRPMLSIRNLRSGFLADVTLDVFPGEIVGLAGLLGAGRSELLRAVFGLDAIQSGEVIVNGVPATGRGPRFMIKNRLGYAPDDRKGLALAAALTVAQNLSAACLQRVSTRGLLSRAREASLANKSIQQLSIKTPSIHTPVGLLSGGNQQKVVIGKWLNARSRLLLLDEPTKGVDVEAKFQLYTILRELASQGLSILVAPSELEELFPLCDRIAVMTTGRVHSFRRAADTSLRELSSLVGHAS